MVLVGLCNCIIVVSQFFNQYVLVGQGYGSGIGFDFLFVEFCVVFVWVDVDCFEKVFYDVVVLLIVFFEELLSYVVEVVVGDGIGVLGAEVFLVYLYVGYIVYSVWLAGIYFVLLLLEDIVCYVQEYQDSYDQEGCFCKFVYCVSVS